MDECPPPNQVAFLGPQNKGPAVSFPYSSWCWASLGTGYVRTRGVKGMATYYKAGCKPAHALCGDVRMSSESYT